jgi:hypothetical protein|tara:strand:+ start:2370 stop:2780 length:411 start_codon:yes stop_codon:yes gene_type:complete
MKNYKHKTTGQPCNSAQYIAEIVCLREAEKANVGRPAYALWNTEKWKKKYQSQVTKAYQLLKKYSDKAIINALNAPRGKSIYSLRVKNLEYLIKDAQKSLDKINPSVIDYNDNTQSKPPKPYGQESIINKLRKLDG